MKRIKTLTLMLAISVFGISAGYFAFAAPSASAISTPPVTIVADLKDDACKGVKQIDSTQGCGTADNKFKRIVARIVNLFSYIIGIAAVVMIMVSGFKYLTSAGEAAKVESSKNALVYALVGLAIVALAQFLVRVVLSTVN